MIFKREPAFWLNLFAALVAWLSTWFLHLSPEMTSAINAVAFGVMGLIIAGMTGDGWVAAVTGLFKALVSLGLGFGLHIDDEMQATAMTLLALLTSAFLRTQVVAPAPPKVTPSV